MLSRSKISWRFSWLLGLGAVGLALVGCDEAGPKCYPVRGRILYKNKPAEGAMVFFHRSEALPNFKGRPHGRADAQGNFQLTSLNHNDGAPAGEYAVTVIWPKGDDIDSPDRLNREYIDPEKPVARVTIREEENVLEPIKIK